VSEILKIKDLRTYFYIENGIIKAVDDVNFSLEQGKTLGIVGESGCGKTVTALSILRLIQSPPGKIVNGKIIYKDTDILNLPLDKMTQIRGNKISMIFQEPMTSLNPVFKIGFQINEAIILHQKLSKKNARTKTIEMLTHVGIPEPERVFDQYPHQLSGGMRQRSMIAMALSCKPDILIADEPTTSLDVTIQAQILDLLEKLQKELNMSIILITHDFGVIAETADDVIVMYAGKIVEKASSLKIFNDPLHPYTKALHMSRPKFDITRTKSHRLSTIKGTVPDLLCLPKGCSFQDRCVFVFDKCKSVEPDLIEIADNHCARCHLYVY
jgi:peptide/nickel transport system ATP-binding protein/oligopeptide transport system ATP-binding protein